MYINNGLNNSLALHNYAHRLGTVMLRKEPIICPRCHQDSGYFNEPLLLVIPPGGVKCRNCEYVIIPKAETFLWRKPTCQIHTL